MLLSLEAGNVTEAAGVLVQLCHQQDGHVRCVADSGRVAVLQGRKVPKRCVRIRTLGKVRRLLSAEDGGVQGDLRWNSQWGLFGKNPGSSPVWYSQWPFSPSSFSFTQLRELGKLYASYI